MKRKLLENIFSIIGLVISLIAFFMGIVMLSQPSGTAVSTSVNFGANFYTYLYQSVAVAASNVCQTNATLARGMGYLLIAAGLIAFCYFGDRLWKVLLPEVAAGMERRRQFAAERQRMAEEQRIQMEAQPQDRGEMKEMEKISKSFIRDLEIDLTPYEAERNSAVSEIEQKKFQLTLEAKEYIQREAYDRAEEVLLENASICHSQGKEEDAYLLEHKAFLCRQMSIYQRAAFDVGSFSAIPYAEVLQTVLTELADTSISDQDYAGFYYFKMLNAKLCRAQGKERDAFLLEQSAAEHGDREEAALREKECLQRLVEAYESQRRE